MKTINVVAAVIRDGKALLSAVVEPELVGVLTWEMKTIEQEKEKWVKLNNDEALLIVEGSELIGKQVRVRLEDGTTSLPYIVPNPVQEEVPAEEISEEEPVAEVEPEAQQEEPAEEAAEEEPAAEEEVIEEYETPLGMDDIEEEPAVEEEPEAEQEEPAEELTEEEPVVEVVEEEPAAEEETAIDELEIVEIFEEAEEIEDYLTACGLEDIVEDEELSEEEPAEQEKAAEEENEIIKENDPDEIIEITEEEPAVIYVYERDENGELVLDENGNPIVTVIGDGEIPVTYLRDEHGMLILDENGDPIPTQTVPADAVIVRTLEDALDPDRTIDIYYSWNNEAPALGGEVTFIAVLNGYDNLEYAIQWQQSKDTVNWNDVAGATGARYTETITRDNYRDYWRVQVSITGVIGE